MATQQQQMQQPDHKRDHQEDQHKPADRQRSEVPLHHHHDRDRDRDHHVVVQTSIEWVVSRDGKEEDVEADDGSSDAGMKCAGVTQQADHFRCICTED